MAYPAGPDVKGQTQVPPGGMEWAASTAKPIPPTGSVNEPGMGGSAPPPVEPRKR
jgi:hypothetical protein